MNNSYFSLLISAISLIVLATEGRRDKYDIPGIHPTIASAVYSAPPNLSLFLNFLTALRIEFAEATTGINLHTYKPVLVPH